MLKLGDSHNLIPHKSFPIHHWSYYLIPHYLMALRYYSFIQSNNFTLALIRPVTPPPFLFSYWTYLLLVFSFSG